MSKWNVSGLHILIASSTLYTSEHICQHKKLSSSEPMASLSSVCTVQESCECLQISVSIPHYNAIKYLKYHKNLLKEHTENMGSLALDTF